jgi:uncharacterized protein (DUF1697 family)
VQTWVALLRGINVAGRRRVSMADLRGLVEDTGAVEVQTYLQSGNVVFCSAEEAERLIAGIEQAIAARLGLDVAVLIRTGRELAAIAGGNPFVADGRDSGTLHVTFLATTPDAKRVGDLDPTFAAPDELELRGREVFLCCPDGYGRSKLTNAFFEKKLAVRATTRNWRTVTALAELARS